MIIKNFEEIIAWKKSKELSIFVYKIFSRNRDYNFNNQIQRASVSIMNNIAEGFERQTNKEFKNFLFISKGSCGEVRSMAGLALELGYISEKDYNKLLQLYIETSKILSGFIKTL